MHASSATGLIGRTEALATLATELDAARAGRGRFVSVVGDAGIGKTRLVEEFVDRIDIPVGRALWGRCPEQSGAPGFWPWRQALRAYAANADPAALAADVGSAAADIVRVVPELAERLPQATARAGGTTGFESDASRFRVLEGITGFLRRAARDALQVVVLDDLHWADAASLQLLAFLARELHGTRLLVVGTYRDVEVDRRPTLLGGIERVSQRIRLRGLVRDDVRRLVEATTGATPPASLVFDVHRITEGNPLFVKELVRVLRDENALDSCELGAAEVKLPVELRATIRRRLEPLALEEQRVLTAAAVIGREFDVAALGATAELDTESVLAHLDAAVAAGIVDEVPGAVGSFRFAHALIRETVYNDVRPAARALLHRRVAHALETSRAPDVDRIAALAHHFFHAGTADDVGTAIRYLEQAGRQAVASLAHDRAAEHFGRAIELACRVRPDDRRRLRLLFALGDATSRTGDVVRGRALYVEAAELAEAIDDFDALAVAALRYQWVSAPIGTLDHDGVRLLERALAGRGDRRDALRVLLLTALARALFFAGDDARLTALVDDAVALARTLGDDRGLGRALNMRQCLLMGPASVAPRIAVGREALAHCERAGDTTGSGIVRVFLIHDLLEAGDVAGAEREVDVYAQRAEASRLVSLRWVAATLRAGLAISAGRVRDGLALVLRAIELLRDAKDPATFMTYCGLLLVARRELGDVDESLEAAVATFAGDYPAMHGWRSALAVLHADAGRLDAARTILAAVARDGYAYVRRDVHHLPSLALLAEAAGLTGDVEHARELYALLAPYADRNVVATWWSATCAGSVERYLGILAATAGRTDVAAAHFERALVANQRLGARAETAHTKVDHARLLLERDASGDRERAMQLVAEARDAADELGLIRVQQRADAVGPIPRLRAAPAHGSVATLRRADEEWHLGLGDRTIVLKSSRGLDYLARLVRDPGTELHVLDLVAASVGPDDGAMVVDTGDAGELLDADARTAYRRRLTDLEGELEEAERFNDPGRAARARTEVEFLTAELRRAVGLGGRSRRAAAASERARLNVTRALGRTIEKIAAEDAALGEHLAASVRRGIYCCYDPDPRLPIRWEL